MLDNFDPHYLIILIFSVTVTFMMILDLGLLNRKSSKTTLKEALFWTCVWVFISLTYSAAVYYLGFPPIRTASGKMETNYIQFIDYLSAYIIELSLSVDNIFVMILIFNYFKTPEEYHKKVLFWGIISVILMRGIFIFIGEALIHHFHWILYGFGVFLIYTGIKMLVKKGEKEEVNIENNKLVKFMRRRFRMTADYEGDKFFVRRRGIIFITPLFLVLIVIESTDLVFALDSIPAVFTITENGYVAFTSNIFAVMGLRSMYFLLSSVMDKFKYLGVGLAFVLMFIGIKMLLEIVHIEIPVHYSLIVVVGIITTSILYSSFKPAKKRDKMNHINPVPETSHVE
ncbi:MAG: TerC family protein [Bacteroidia bacterium]|nr:TerC family protein [Bacteroidia bacterium]MDW8345600.1 TerC family protein [Bacteroidia bacterium]